MTVRHLRHHRAGAAGALLCAAAITLGTTWFGGAANATTVAQAKTHLLVLSDMPSGWKVEGPASSSSNNFPGAKQLARCIGVAPKLITANPPEANSPYFSDSTGQLEVQDSLTVFPSVKNAQAEYRAMASSKTAGCLAAIFNSPAFKSKITGSGPSGTKLGTITISRVSGTFPGGTVGYTATLPITTQGDKITGLSTVVMFIRGDLGQQVEFDSYGSRFPTSLAKQLTQVAINRL